MKLHYPFPEKPAPGTLQAVAPGVFWLRMALPFQLDHINLWLIEDGAGWCLVDTGFADDASREAWRAVLDSLQAPVTRLVVTHFHPDHLGLATWLQEQTGAPLYMTTSEFLTAHAVWNEVGGWGARFMVEQFRSHGLRGERLAKYETRGSGYRVSVPALPQHYQRLLEGDMLSIGGQQWRVWVGHGHSPEHATLYCAELGVFISGDMLLPKISTNISVPAATPQIDSLGAFLDSLQRMAAELPAGTLVLPSHGLPFNGIQPRVAALQQHHAERLQALEAACAQPLCAAEAMAVLFPRPLDAHQTMFAMGETIAHFNYLEKTGRLRRQIDPEGGIRFVRNP